MSLPVNVGRFDQFLRIGIGLFLIWIGFVDATLLGNGMVPLLVGTFGALNLVAAVLRVCPVYALLGINTNNQDD